MTQKIREKGVYVQPQIVTIELGSDAIMIPGGSGVSAETGSDPVGNPFGGSTSAKESSFWEESNEE